MLIGTCIVALNPSQKALLMRATATAQPVSPSTPSSTLTATTIQSPRRLIVIWVLWVLAVGLYVGQYGTELLTFIELRSTLCTTNCTQLHVDAELVAPLLNFGVPYGLVAYGVLFLEAFLIIGFWGVALMLVWLRPRDWLALALATSLLFAFTT
jgi:hypothetical protein